ncbi:hypothetical protein B0H19DRAFT_1081530 [Mycena capillaripes]|nr:hypothetical protein B0H19DRAFT_1081530 [Mycena capillaripes]
MVHQGTLKLGEHILNSLKDKAWDFNLNTNPSWFCAAHGLALGSIATPVISDFDFPGAVHLHLGSPLVYADQRAAKIMHGIFKRLQTFFTGLRKRKLKGWSLNCYHHWLDASRTQVKLETINSRAACSVRSRVAPCAQWCGAVEGRLRKADAGGGSAWRTLGSCTNSAEEDECCVRGRGRGRAIVKACPEGNGSRRVPVSRKAMEWIQRQRISLSCARLQGLKSQVAGALLRSPKFRNFRDHQATAVCNGHILHTPPPESGKPTLVPISRTTVARSGASAKIQYRQKHRLRQTTVATCAHIFQVPLPGAAKPSSHPSSQRNMKSGQSLHSHRL